MDFNKFDNLMNRYVSKVVHENITEEESTEDDSGLEFATPAGKPQSQQTKVVNQTVAKGTISDQITTAFSSKGYGIRDRMNTLSAKGFNIVSSTDIAQPPRVKRGMVFFTRPNLNLTYVNLSRERTLLPWRDSDPMSYMGMARALLDPLSLRIRHVVKDFNGIFRDPEQYNFSSPLVDQKNTFMPILSNSLLSLSGWPDQSMDHFMSDKGLANEQWMMADGLVDNLDGFSLDCTFRNKEGDPLLMIFFLWIKYMSYVRTNRIFPHPEMIAKRRLDYMTRIYAFNLDENERYITHWANCGAGMPTNIAIGKYFDYDYDKKLKEGLDNLSIKFQCVGAEYMDMASLHDFNKTVAIANPDLALFRRDVTFTNITPDRLDNIPYANRGSNEGKNAVYLKVRPTEKLKANYHVYPLVNLYTKELEWWIHRDDYITFLLEKKAVSKAEAASPNIFLGPQGTQLKNARTL